MKKRLSTILACILLITCVITTASASGCGTTVPTRNETTPPPTPGTLAFDIDVDEPPFPYPVQRLCYNAFVDYPFTFERQKIPEDDKTAEEWTKIEPVTLYRWPDDSWRSVAPSSTDSADLRQEPFYLVESGYNYRVTVNFDGRFKNISRVSSVASFMMHDVYSGHLDAGRTGILSIELGETINGTSADSESSVVATCIIHRSQLRIANTDGVHLMPISCTSGINGQYVITYSPSESENIQDYYSDTTTDLILQEQTIPISLHNVLQV